MKRISASCPISAFILSSVLLCGGTPTSVLAQDASSSAAHHYVFTAAALESDVYVRLTDDLDEDFNPIVVEVLSDAGGMSRLDRAKKIADRLQRAADTDSAFIGDIKVANEGGEVVIVVSSLQSQLVITADDRSKRTANAPTRQIYAQRILANIQSRLKGIKLRDAAFDYQLTGDQRRERAYEYYKQGQDAYLDKDTAVAVSKYRLALALSPDYEYCRLRLASVYAELGNSSAARKLYQQVAAAALADPDDKKAAISGLQKLPVERG